MGADSGRVVDVDVGALPPAHGSFETWYRATHPRLLATLTVMSGDIEAARDATAEAFTRALERWPRVRSMDAPEAWVHRVGVNVLRRQHRRRVVEERLLRRHRPEPAPPSHLSPDVWDALAALPSRQREAIALRYLLDLTQADVADAMGVAPGTAAATLHAARRNLADRLGLDDTDDVEVASRD
jgi:RNA polymerase sigma-70 factor (ECF subfamily)